MTILFHSDQSTHFKGFNLTYQQGKKNNFVVIGHYLKRYFFFIAFLQEKLRKEFSFYILLAASHCQSRYHVLYIARRFSSKILFPQNNVMSLGGSPTCYYYFANQENK